MIRRRAAAAGIETKIGNHTFGATGITAYLSRTAARSKKPPPWRTMLPRAQSSSRSPAPRGEPLLGTRGRLAAVWGAAALSAVTDQVKDRIADKSLVITAADTIGDEVAIAKEGR